MSETKHQIYHGLVDGYFNGVVAEDADGVFGLFADDTEITIFHGDNPSQKFRKTPGPGERPFIEFYSHLWKNYVADFADRQYIIDADADRGAAIFAAVLKTKPDSAYLETGDLILNNCNFFWFANGKISKMYIYYANPTLGAKLNLTYGHPTPFPRA